MVGDPVNLEHMVVTATPFVRSQAEIAAATTVLSGRALQSSRAPTLGETLSREVGISATAFGPGSSRPIIRGLGGDRIRILENGSATLDASVTSPDHAVSVEPFLVERIEVVRGPASLLHGSSAVGGVVNVITHRIEDSLPERGISGEFEVRYGSGANERAGGGVVDTVLHRRGDAGLVLHLDGFRRRAGDLEIGGFAESARLRAEEAEEAKEHGEEPPEEISGRIPNTSLSSDGGAAGLSWVSPRLNLGAVFSAFDSNYGIPAGAHAHGHDHEEAADVARAGDEEEHGHGDENVRIDLRQRRVDVHGEWRSTDAALRSVRFKFGHADYRHVELEGEEVGTRFANTGYDARLEGVHAPLAGFEGAVGVQVTRSEFDAVGEEAFVPSSLTRGRAVFLFEETSTGPVRWQAGARHERQEITLRSGAAARAESTLSAGAGLVWTLDSASSFALSLSRTERAPNAQELYSNGPHAGTGAYEIGDATLRAEESLGIEASYRRRAGFVTGVVSVFQNRFDGHIAEFPTGQEEDGLEVYRYEQRDATFRGAEIEGIFHLHEGGRHRFDLRVGADTVRAKDADGGALPRIPPFKARASLDWSSGGFAVGVNVLRAARQSRVTEDEEPTDGYTLVGFDAGYRVEVGALAYDFFLVGRNLTNAEARVHTSFLKEVAPLGGRSLTAGVRLAF
jgi:iron complex outermembrane recepter protein